MVSLFAIWDFFMLESYDKHLPISVYDVKFKYLQNPINNLKIKIKF